MDHPWLIHDNPLIIRAFPMNSYPGFWMIWTIMDVHRYSAARLKEAAGNAAADMSGTRLRPFTTGGPCKVLFLQSCILGGAFPLLSQFVLLRTILHSMI